jgi:hypothetical protein
LSATPYVCEILECENRTPYLKTNKCEYDGDECVYYVDFDIDTGICIKECPGNLFENVSMFSFSFFFFFFFIKKLFVTYIYIYIYMKNF